MKLFTSIPAKLSQKQLAELRITASMWKKAGASLSSLNFSEEARNHPITEQDLDITIIDCGQQKDFSYNRRPLIPIDLAAQKIRGATSAVDIIGIVNADIRPNLLYDWSAIIHSVECNELHLFKRLEEESSPKDLFDPYSPYHYGYDLFMLKAETLPLEIINNQLFCFGVPWWDYWFPLMMKAKTKCNLASHDRPYITHISHPEKFEQEIWQEKARFVFDYIILNAKTIVHPKKIPVPLDPIKLADFCVDVIDSDSYVRANGFEKSECFTEGISIVTACMNRNENLMKCMPSWLRLSAVSEIIVVDWGSSKKVEQSLRERGIADNRIKVIRIEDQDTWILSHAFNVGLSQVRRKYILKLDCDILLKDDFLEKNPPCTRKFYAGNWRVATSDDEKRLNGSFLAPTQNIRSIGYYNEEITTYGWDDCDLYQRLEILLVRSVFDFTTITHIKQEDDSRLKYQSNTLGLSPIVYPCHLSEEIEIRTNQILARFAPRPHEKLRLSRESKILARLIGYRYTLARILSQPWSQGGVHIKYETLTRLSSFCLATLVAFRYSRVGIARGGAAGSMIVDCYLDMHPVCLDDYRILKAFRKNKTKDHAPLFSQANKYAFPKLKVEEQFFQDVSRMAVLCVAALAPMRNITANLLRCKSRIEKQDASFHSSICRMTGNKRFTSMTVAVNSSRYYPGFLEDAHSILSKRSHGCFFSFIGTSSSSIDDIRPLLDLASGFRNEAQVVILTWDPGLYNCWNLICTESISKYLGNWNCDDRRDPKHIAKLCDLLDADDSLLGASSALHVARVIPESFSQERTRLHETWFAGDSFTYDFRDMYQIESWVPGSDEIVSQNFMHCLPVWRKSLHEEENYFDETRFGPSADWEFWMRRSMALNRPYFLLGVPLAVYYLNPSSYGRKDNMTILESNINSLYMRYSKAYHRKTISEKKLLSS